MSPQQDHVGLEGARNVEEEGATAGVCPARILAPSKCVWGTLPAVVSIPDPSTIIGGVRQRYPMSEKDTKRLHTEAVLRGQMSRRTWNKFQDLPGFSLPQETFRTDYEVKAALDRESPVEIEYIHCCVNRCRLFYGSFAEDTECICQAPRYLADVSHSFTSWAAYEMTLPSCYIYQRG